MKVVAKERAQRAISETGTGFACAKLSEVLPPVANAPVVRMTQNAKLSEISSATLKTGSSWRSRCSLRRDD
jgi:hypothetical protein